MARVRVNGRGQPLGTTRFNAFGIQRRHIFLVFGKNLWMNIPVFQRLFLRRQHMGNRRIKVFIGIQPLLIPFFQRGIRLLARNPPAQRQAVSGSDAKSVRRVYAVFQHDPHHIERVRDIETVESEIAQDRQNLTGKAGRMFVDCREFVMAGHDPVNQSFFRQRCIRNQAAPDFFLGQNRTSLAHMRVIGFLPANAGIVFGHRQKPGLVDALCHGTSHPDNLIDIRAEGARVSAAGKSLFFSCVKERIPDSIISHPGEDRGGDPPERTRIIFPCASRRRNGQHVRDEIGFYPSLGVGHNEDRIIGRLADQPDGFLPVLGLRLNPDGTETVIFHHFRRVENILPSMVEVRAKYHADFLLPRQRARVNRPDFFHT